MNTGTTIDNIYGVTAINHEFSQGKFKTNLTLHALDSYGRYETAGNYDTLVRDIEKANTPSLKDGVFTADAIKGAGVKL